MIRVILRLLTIFWLAAASLTTAAAAASPLSGEPGMHAASAPHEVCLRSNEAAGMPSAEEPCLLCGAGVHCYCGHIAVIPSSEAVIPAAFGREAAFPDVPDGKILPAVSEIFRPPLV